MKPCMICAALKNLKVRNPIVCFNSIPVMNNFMWKKFSLKMLLHENAMFQNISVLIARIIKHNVSVSLGSPSTLPTSSLFPSESFLRVADFFAKIWRHLSSLCPRFFSDQTFPIAWIRTESSLFLSIVRHFKTFSTNTLKHYSTRLFVFATERSSHIASLVDIEIYSTIKSGEVYAF